MPHQSFNNFRAFFSRYPFSGNTMVQLLANENSQDDDVINAGFQQIEDILNPAPFEPEYFAFVRSKEDPLWSTYTQERDNVTKVILKRRDGNGNHGRWTIQSLTAEGKVFFPEFPVFIPNHVIGTIMLISLGMIARADLGADGKGCPNDEDKDGICPSCESMGRCIFEPEKAVVLSSGDDTTKEE